MPASRPQCQIGRMSLSRDICSLLPLRADINRKWLGISVVLPLMLAIATVAGAQKIYASSQSSAPLVDWSHVKRGYRYTERWVTAGRSDNQPPIHVSGLLGAHITLRHRGWTIGHGQITKEELDTENSEFQNLTQALQSATERALNNVAKSLRRRSGEYGPDHRQMPNVSELAPHLTVDLQVAHRLEDITWSANRHMHGIKRQFSAGFHGLRLMPPVNHPHAQPAWSWPATNLAGNRSPRQQLAFLFKQFGLGLKDGLESINRHAGPKLQRFEVIHLTRNNSTHPIQHLIRGNIVLPSQALTMATIDSMADRMATYLIANQYPQVAVNQDAKTAPGTPPPGSFQGRYEPTADRLTHRVVKPDQTALIAYALARYAKFYTPSSGKAPSAARKSCRLALQYLATKQGSSKLAVDPRAVALAILAVSQAPHLSDLKTIRDRFTEMLVNRYAHQPLFDQDPKSNELESAAVAISALAEIYSRTRDETAEKMLRTFSGQLWSKLAQHQHVSAMCWSIGAHLRIHRFTQPSPSQTDQHQHRIDMVRSMADRLLQHQITTAPQLGPEDVIGGFDDSSAPHRLAPAPNWQSAHALRLLAVTARTPELLSNTSRLDRIIQCTLAARFIAQLMYDEPSCFYMRNAPRVIGAVRTSLTDNTLDITHTATGLLAIIELKQSLVELAGVD